MPITRIGIIDSEFGDDVEAVRTDMRVKAIDAELPDLVLDRGHPARREHP